MKNKLFVVLGFLFVATTAANAQKLVTKSGNLDFLKGQKEFNVEFIFDKTTFGKANKPEAEFIKEKVDENNKKEAGQGDKWLEDWNNAKAHKFPEKFISIMKEEMPADVSVNTPTAKYICMVKPLNMETGFKIGMSTIPAKVDFELSWADASDKTKTLCVQTLENVPGSQAMGFDFTSSSRLAESFAKAGKILGKNLESNVY